MAKRRNKGITKIVHDIGVDKSGIRPSAGLTLNGISIGESLTPLTIDVNGDEDFITGILHNIIATILVIIVMVQLRLSVGTKQNNTYMDLLPSYKAYKAKIIHNFPGDVLSVTVGLAKAYPYMILSGEYTAGTGAQEIYELIQAYSETTVPNCKRVAKPSPSNWFKFMQGEICAMPPSRGYMGSCPSTHLNLDSRNIHNFGIEPWTLVNVDKFGGKESLIEGAIDIVLQYMAADAGGMPTVLSFKEPSNLWD